MRARLLSSGLVVLGLLLSTRPARAFERQHHLALDPGLAVLKVADKSTASVGAGGAVHYSYGLDDQFLLVAEAGSHVVAREEKLETPETPRTRPTGVHFGAVGLAYALDVIRWVPYFGVLGSGYSLTGGTLERSRGAFGAQLALGLDYAFSRHLYAGIAVRQHMLLTDVETYPTYTTVALRIGAMWGF